MHQTVEIYPLLLKSPPTTVFFVSTLLNRTTARLSSPSRFSEEEVGEEETRMLVGKWAKPPRRRSDSSVEFIASPASSTAILFDVEAPRSSDEHVIGGEDLSRGSRYFLPSHPDVDVSGVYIEDPAVAAAAPFLRACGLCSRRLGPGQDTYMYRGDTAFCSSECRQQQINKDEQKVKCSSISMNENSSLASNCCNQSDIGGTIPAATRAIPSSSPPVKNTLNMISTDLDF